ncbi:MAG: alpha/beta hydrolase [Cyanobacteriota bacterium]|nr:alpha/beta hydrolase [Cyanobacteriota bacterium]
MFPPFLPKIAKNLTESTSIDLAQHIEAAAIAMPSLKVPIATTFVRQGTTQSTPILLLHGFDSSVFEFRRLLPLLAQKRETWAIDLLGFGFTDRTAGNTFTTTDIKIHLYSFWKTLIDRPIILIGASMGGAAAIDFTLTYPDAVEKLVLLDSAGLAKGPVMGKFLVPPIDRLATEFLRRPQVRRNISQTAYYDKKLNSLDAQLCAALHLEMPGWHEALVSFTKSGGYGSFRDRLGQLETSTLVIWGENDKILGTKDAGKFERAIANSQLVWVEKCGHVPHLEQPEITADFILTQS